MGLVLALGLALAAAPVVTALAAGDPVPVPAADQATTTVTATMLHRGSFLSPDGLVWCVMDSTSTFCATGGGQSQNPNPPETSGGLAPNGKVSICRVAAASFSNLCLQNWDPTSPILSDGQRNAVANFLCSSAANTITCVIAFGPGKGRGFVINASSVRRIGPAGPPPPPVPVLGDFDGGTAGFGVAHPASIGFGMAIITNMTHIHWRHWGAARATGSGTGYWVPDGKPFSAARPAPAQIVAFDLGTCHGTRAYLKVEFWLPSKGGRFNPRNAYPACL